MHDIVRNMHTCTCYIPVPTYIRDVANYFSIGEQLNENYRDIAIYERKIYLRQN